MEWSRYNKPCWVIYLKLNALLIGQIDSKRTEKDLIFSNLLYCNAFVSGPGDSEAKLKMVFIVGYITGFFPKLQFFSFNEKKISYTCVKWNEPSFCCSLLHIIKKSTSSDRLISKNSYGSKCHYNSVEILCICNH